MIHNQIATWTEFPILAMFIIDQATCNNAAFLFRNVLVPFWSLKIHKRLTQRVTLLLAGWRIYLKFFHLKMQCHIHIWAVFKSNMYSKAVFLIRNATLVSFWSLKIHKMLTQHVTQLMTRGKIYSWTPACDIQFWELYLIFIKHHQKHHLKCIGLILVLENS